MSTMVQMPVRVKPPPADTGEIISPGCASFEIATPSNGARTTMSFEIGLARVDLRLRDLDLLLRHRDPRLQRLDLRLGGVELGARDDLLLHQLLPAAERQLRFPQPRLVLGGGPPAPRCSCASSTLSMARSCESSSRARTWPALHRLAFLDEDLHDLAGHLRRHGRPPARRDVARGVEDRVRRARRAAAHGRLRGPDLDHRLAPRPIHHAGGDREQQEDDEGNPDARTAAAAAGLRDQCASEASSSLRFVVTMNPQYMRTLYGVPPLQGRAER